MTLAFLATALVIVATPGTGAVLTIASGLRGGPRRAAVTAFGCTLGIVPHLAAAVTGAAALLHASGVAYEVVRWAGVAYLLVMAARTWRERGLLAVEADQRPASPVRLVVSAVLANLLNPKLTLFFFTFLPQFVPATSPRPVADMLALSGVFMAMTFVVFLLYGVFAAASRRTLTTRPRVVSTLQRGFAATYVVLAGRLATTDR